MKKSLQSKLKKYGTAAAAVSMVAGVSDADAQVMYTDVNPDQTFTNNGDSYNLDLNGDATIDFTINLTVSSGVYKVGITNAGSNQNMGSGSTAAGWNYPLALSYGASIGSAGPWQSGASNASALFSYYGSSSTYGLWGGATDKYLGLKFDIGGNTHYGWARLDVAANGSSFTIKDYAYESTADSNIVAGDMGSVSVSVAENLFSKDIKVFTTQGQLQVNIPTEYVGYNLKVIDVAGSEVLNSRLMKTITKFDLSENANGVYLLLISGDNNTFTQKVVLN